MRTSKGILRIIGGKLLISRPMKTVGAIHELPLRSYKSELPMSLTRLISQINLLKKSKIKSVIDERIKEFKRQGNASIDNIFNELCFCILTANFNAERTIKIQKNIGRGFCILCEKDLAMRLKEFGHRFPNMRAKFIVEARKHKKSLFDLLKSEKDERIIRDWVTKNIKGLGYKESSHFLRNIGRDDCAIIDFHIVDILAENKLIKKCKTLSKKQYLEIEKILEQLAEKLDLTLAKLDLYLWYLETGKVLK